MAKARIALYFGSFNPIHLGHTALVQYALGHLPIDELWLVLSPLNPHKAASEQLPFAYRAQLARGSIASLGGVRLCLIEQSLPAPRYTVRTLRALELLHPGVEFVLLIGADTLLSMPSWYTPERIFSRYPLYVYPRPGYEVSLEEWQGRAQVHLLAGVPESALSSSAIRSAVRVGEDLSYALPQPEVWSGLCAEFARLESQHK